MKAKNSPNLKLLLLLAPIAAIVAISGCTGTTSGPTFGNGVAILNWEPDFSSVESGDQLQLRIRIQNQGETTAQDVTAMLAGINGEDWGLSGMMNSGIEFNDLLPPNRIQNTEGQTAQDTFDLTAPNLPKGTTQQYSPLVRISYHYKTSVIKSITLVNENELRRLQDQGKTLSSTDTKTSAGPLSVTITTGKFIKAREAGSVFSRVFPITIVITNVGGGVVSSGSTSAFDTADDYMIDIANVQLPSRLSLVSGSCEEFDSRVITLWKGQSASITCNLQINQPPLANEDENLGITLEYDYYIDRTTSITVTGTEENLFGF